MSRWLLPILLLLLLSAEVESKKKKKSKTVKASVSGDGSVKEAEMLITVDDVEDRIKSGEAGSFSAQDSRCSVSSVSPDAKLLKIPTLADDVNGCSLRGALEMAIAVGGGSWTKILMRPGRFRLAAPLPEVSGKILIVGSPGRKKAKKVKLPPKRQGKPTEAEVSS